MTLTVSRYLPLKKRGCRLNVWIVCGYYPQIVFFDIHPWVVKREKKFVRCLAFAAA